MIFLLCPIPCRRISDVLLEAISTRQVLSLYQGLGTKNVQSFVSSFIYFYGYSYFKKLYLKKTGNKNIGTAANLIAATAAGVCTIVITQASQNCNFFQSTTPLSTGKWMLCVLSIDCPIIISANKQTDPELITCFVQTHPFLIVRHKIFSNIYYFTALRYNILKDADKWVWKIQRILEDPFRGYLEWCIWWSWHIYSFNIKPVYSGITLRIFIQMKPREDLLF